MKLIHVSCIISNSVPIICPVREGEKEKREEKRGSERPADVVNVTCAFIHSPVSGYLYASCRAR